jgi:hypothetical protein
MTKPTPVDVVTTDYSLGYQSVYQRFDTLILLIEKPQLNFPKQQHTL